MKNLQEFAEHLDDLLDQEQEAAFLDYFHQATSGLEIDQQSLNALKSLARQAFEKGISPSRLKEIIKQSM